MRTRIHGSGRRRAAAAVELAVLLPTVLVPLILGIWEMGRVVEVQQVLDNAVREGGRQVSTGKQSNSQVQQVVLQYLADAGLNNNGAVVTVTNVTSGLDATQANQLDRFTVTVSLPYGDIGWTSLGVILSPSATLNASTNWYSMRDIPLTISQTIPAAPQ
jgi:Flp pilus assembly protein TadG